MSVEDGLQEREVRERDTFSFTNDSSSQEDTKEAYDIADLTLDTQREVKELIKTIEQTYKNELQTSFTDLRQKINNRQFYVMFEPKLNTDALSDHKIPRSVLPILEPFVKDAHDEVAVALDSNLVELIVSSFGRTYKTEIDIKYKEQQMIDELEIELHRYQTDAAVELKIIDSLEAQIINERQKYVKELEYIHEEAFEKARVGGKYEPDFSDATAQAEEIFNLPEIQSIDLMRSRSTKEPRVENQRLKILSQECAIMEKELADYDNTKQKVTTLQSKLKIAEDDLVEERRSLTGVIDDLTKQLNDTKEEIRVSEVQARDAVSFMNLKIDENEHLLERMKEYEGLERQYQEIIQEYGKTKNKLDKASKDLDKTNMSLNEKSELAENEKNAIIVAKDEEILDLKVENDELTEEIENLNAKIGELLEAKGGETENTSEASEETVSVVKIERKSKKKASGPELDDFTQQFPESSDFLKTENEEERHVIEEDNPQFRGLEPVSEQMETALFKEEFEAKRQITGFNWMVETVDDTMRQELSNMEDFRSRIKGKQIKELRETDYLLNLFLAEYPELRGKLLEPNETEELSREDKNSEGSESKAKEKMAAKLEEIRQQTSRLPPRPEPKQSGSAASSKNALEPELIFDGVKIEGKGSESQNNTEHTTNRAGDLQEDQYVKDDRPEVENEIITEQFEPHEELQFNQLNEESVRHSYSQQQIIQAPTSEGEWQRLEQLNESLQQKKEQVDKICGEYEAEVHNLAVFEKGEPNSANLGGNKQESKEELTVLENEMRYSCQTLKNEIEESERIVEQAEVEKESGKLTEQQLDIITEEQRMVAVCENDVEELEELLGVSDKVIPADALKDVLTNKQSEASNSKADNRLYLIPTGDERQLAREDSTKKNVSNDERDESVHESEATQEIPNEERSASHEAQEPDHSGSEHDHFISNPLLAEKGPARMTEEQRETHGEVSIKEQNPSNFKDEDLSEKRALSQVNLAEMNENGMVSFEINPSEIVSNHEENEVNEHLAMQIRFVASEASSIYSDELIEVEEEISEQNDDYIMEMIIEEENTRAKKLIEKDSEVSNQISGDDLQSKPELPRFSSKEQLTVLLGGHVDMQDSIPPIGDSDDKKELIINALKDELFEHIFTASPAEPDCIDENEHNFDNLLTDKEAVSAVLQGEKLTTGELQIVQAKMLNPKTIKIVAERVPELNDDAKKVVETLYSSKLREELQNGNLSLENGDVLRHLFFNRDIIDVMAGDPLIVKSFLEQNFKEQQLKSAIKGEDLLAFHPAQLAADLQNSLETAKIEGIEGQVVEKLEQLVSDDTDTCLASGDESARKIGYTIADILENPAVLERLLQQNIDKTVAKKLYVLLDKEKIEDLKNGQLSADEIRELIGELSDPKIANLLVDSDEMHQSDLKDKLEERRERSLAMQQLNNRAEQIFDPKVAQRLASGELDEVTCNALLRILNDKEVTELLTESRFSEECEEKLSAVLYNPEVIMEVKQGGIEAIKLVAQALYDPEVIAVLSQLLNNKDAQTTAMLCSDIVQKIPNKRNVLNSRPFNIETSVVRGREVLHDLEQEYKLGARGEICSSIKISQNIDKGYTSKPVSPFKSSPQRRQETTHAHVIVENEKEAPSFIRSYELPTEPTPPHVQTGNKPQQELEQRVNSIRYTQPRKASPKNVACCIVGIANTPVRVNTGPAGGRHNQAVKGENELSKKVGEMLPSAEEERTGLKTPQARSESEDARSEPETRISFMMELPYKEKDLEDEK